ncbi:hypothetical protein H0H93_012115 [Arthromyces matolae]|nr:hypothetical protein H0H93_012115 [Arthromyces matolae]
MWVRESNEKDANLEKERENENEWDGEEVVARWKRGRFSRAAMWGGKGGHHQGEGEGEGEGSRWGRLREDGRTRWEEGMSFFPSVSTYSHLSSQVHTSASLAQPSKTSLNLNVDEWTSFLILSPDHFHLQDRADTQVDGESRVEPQKGREAELENKHERGEIAQTCTTTGISNA